MGMRNTWKERIGRAKYVILEQLYIITRGVAMSEKQCKGVGTNEKKGTWEDRRASYCLAGPNHWTP